MNSTTGYAVTVWVEGAKSESEADAVVTACLDVAARGLPIAFPGVKSATVVPS